jgi:hypothetical protein
MTHGGQRESRGRARTWLGERGLDVDPRRTVGSYGEEGKGPREMCTASNK